MTKTKTSAQIHSNKNWMYKCIKPLKYMNIIFLIRFYIKFLSSLILASSRFRQHNVNVHMCLCHVDMYNFAFFNAFSLYVCTSERICVASFIYICEWLMFWRHAIFFTRLVISFPFLSLVLYNECVYVEKGRKMTRNRENKRKERKERMGYIESSAHKRLFTLYCCMISIEILFDSLFFFSYAF